MRHEVSLLLFGVRGVEKQDLLPVAPHVPLLQIAIAKGNLASVAGIRVGSGSIHLDLTTDKGGDTLQDLL